MVKARSTIKPDRRSVDDGDGDQSELGMKKKPANNRKQPSDELIVVACGPSATVSVSEPNPKSIILDKKCSRLQEELRRVKNRCSTLQERRTKLSQVRARVKTSTESAQKRFEAEEEKLRARYDDKLDKETQRRIIETKDRSENLKHVAALYRSSDVHQMKQNMDVEVREVFGKVALSKAQRRTAELEMNSISVMLHATVATNTKLDTILQKPPVPIEVAREEAEKFQKLKDEMNLLTLEHDKMVLEKDQLKEALDQANSAHAGTKMEYEASIKDIKDSQKICRETSGTICNRLREKIDKIKCLEDECNLLKAKLEYAEEVVDALKEEIERLQKETAKKKRRQDTHQN